ncbi:MAG: PLP-dependent aminotransferase family protein [Firmicutes bacterium]|nr:PLP-dependent aminotransferase family protein [Bacillota bacterium]
MNITVNKSEKTPLYLQISGQIKKMIYNGTLVNGSKLPSERQLADNLNVHRNTVVKAYAELKYDDLISSYQGQYYYVSFGTMYYGMVKKPVNWEALIKDEYISFDGDFDELFNKSYEKDIISFGGGVAAREIYPHDEMASVFETILHEKKDGAYFHTPYQGDQELRKEIVSFLSTKGINTQPGNIQLFTENNQALDFIMTLMLQPGDKVIVPEALSPDIYRAIQFAGGQLLTVPMDEDGMICENLDPLIEKEKPKFMYVDSSFNNPTGTILSLERRKMLLELSYKYRVPIIEEDEGSELYYDIDILPSIKSMDTGHNVIYMYSFSLTTMPGTGLSFVAADTNVVKKLSELVSMKIVSLDWVPQKLLLEYMKNGVFKERLDGFRDVCRKKRDLMYSILRGTTEDLGLKCDLPKGGVYLWVKLPTGIDGRELLKEVQKAGVTFIPGYVFYPQSHRGNDHIRLNFSYPTEKEIEAGMSEICKKIRQTLLNFQNK